MASIRRTAFHRRALPLLTVVLAAAFFAAPLGAQEKKGGERPAKSAGSFAVANAPSTSADAAPPPVAAPAGAAAVFTKAVPESLEDLRAIERQVTALSEDLIRATVGVRIGRAQGSGVIVSDDGYVLTAAHVAGSPGREVEFILHDGRKVRGKTLGLHRGLDAGLMQITTEGKWTVAEMGDMDEIRVGDWCVATGHPGGYHDGRAPVVRLGRVVLKRDSVIQSDCALVGGDSGGPLFDMQGRVIGIHSRIGPSIVWNFHVPISAYEEGWERMVASEVFGGRPSRGSAVMGVNGDDHAEGAEVTGVSEGFPAEEAGLRVGDVITKIEGKSFKGFDGLAQLVLEQEPGDVVEVEFLRDGKRTTVKVTLAARE
ncbi:MAG: trypsin-like peptidase domain-containing protein [Planctomycetales bacterium]